MLYLYIERFHMSNSIENIRDVLVPVLKGGFIAYCNKNPEALDFLVRLINKCKINENDDDVTKIFKTFISYGVIGKTTSGTNGRISSDDIYEAIKYRQTQDFELNFIGKSMYWKNCKRERDFIEQQLNLMSESGENIPDLKAEYMKFLESCGHDSYSVQSFVREHYE